MRRRALAVVFGFAALLAACDRVIDLSRKGIDASEGPDTRAPGDGGPDGPPDDAGAADGGTGPTDA